MRAILGNAFNIKAGNGVRVVPATFVLLALLVAGLTACGESSQPTAQPAEPSAPAAPQATSPAAQQPARETDSSAATGAPPPTAAASSQADSPTTAPVETATAAAPEPSPTTLPENTPTTVPTEPAAAPETAGSPGLAIGEGSEATFTVNEKLAWLDLPNDAVMRTVGLSGTIHLDGQPSIIELDLHSMTSDSDRRDGYVRNRMFPNDRTATFTVTSLGDLPDPLPEGEEIAREVQGELTIKGVTKPITFQVQARQDPDKLFVLGRTTFTWEYLEIPPPNIPGRIQVKDEVHVEVLLSAVPIAP